MRLRESIDCLIPRGGPSLIRSILDNATVPYVIDGDGNCHVYVDASADLDMAADIVVNAKTQRPSVCNAAESLVVHDAVAATSCRGWRRCSTASSWSATSASALARCPRRARATDEDYASEFLDLKLSVGVVDSLDEAIDHITRFGSGHTRGHRHPRSRRGRPVLPRGRRRRGARERVDPLRRRRGVRVRRRDRHHHPEAARPRPDGPARAHDA